MIGNARAFTLIEVLIGLTVNAIVLTAVIAVFSFAMNEQHLERVRAQLGREGAALGQQLANEVRLAGLGRPSSRVAPGAAGDIPLHFLVAQRESIGFLADLPRPDASYNTFGILHDHPAGPNHIMWHTDNNGTCAPSNGGGSCSTADSSVLFPGEAGCGAGGALDRTCPWGSKRLRGGDYFQIVAGDGTFFRAHTSVIATEASASPDGGDVLALILDSPFPIQWPNNARGDAPVDIRGQGWVTTIDRVFFRYVSTRRVIERRQCWGDFAIQDGNWPPRATNTNAGTLAEGSSFDPSSVPNAECTVWGLVARDVRSVRFDYLDAVGNNIGTPSTDVQRANVARVQWQIRLERTVNNRPVGQDVVGAVRLRNI